MAHPRALAEMASLLTSYLAFKENDVSFQTRISLLNAALCASEFCPHEEQEYCSCWVVDVFDTWLAFRSNGETYRLDYSIGSDNAVAFAGPAVKVIPVMTYPVAPGETPAAEVTEKQPPVSKGSPFVERSEVELIGDCQPFALELSEAAVSSEPATALVKLIAPGWGSSGYYSPTVLQKAAGVFRKGLHMFIDHPTAAEEAARPEGSVLNIGGELMEDARWREDLPSGPGLYALARVFSKFKNSLRELKDSIGVSIRAFGSTHQGEAEGRKGPLVDEISIGRSVDFVTMAGAGGKITQMIESRRSAAIPKEQTTMTAEEQARFEALEKSNAALQARLDEGARLATARTKVEAILETIQMPDATRKRLGASLPMRAPFVNGVLDEAALKTMVETAATEELRYLEQIGGGSIVRGAGSSFQESKQPAWTEKEEKGFRQTLSALSGKQFVADDSDATVSTKFGR